jgi:hypothetical protein
MRAMRRSRVDRRGLAVVAGGAAVVAVAIVVVLQSASTHTIVQRGTLGYLPFVGDRGIVNSANELLWERFGYGPAAIEMVKSHPIQGVGVGMFHTLAHDFGKLRGYKIPPDNAQNWFRQIIAELGLVGFVPVLWWCVVLAALLFARTGAGDPLATGMLRGVLIGFGVASMFGIPGQSAAVVITVWTLVFWLLHEHGGTAPPVRVPPALARHGVAIAAVLVGLHLGATAVDAYQELRPRHRAMRFNWAYQYGFMGLEPDPGGHPVHRRWTWEDALAVIPVKGKVLKFVGWIDHPDGDANPPHVTVRADGRTVFDGPLTRSSPIFLDVAPTPGRTHMVIETSIDRLYRPSEHGSRDRRSLGLSVRDWVWE